MFSRSMVLGFGFVMAGLGVPHENASAIGLISVTEHAATNLVSVSLRESELHDVLDRRGYYDIALIDRTAVVEACRRGVRYRLVLDDDGRPTRETRLDPCHGQPVVGYRAPEPAVAEGEPAPDRPPAEEILNPGDLRAFLRSRGYYRIEVIDDRGARLAADACSGEDRFRVTVNRLGDIIDKRPLGPCSKAKEDEHLRVGDVRDLLEHRFYTAIRIVTEGPDGIVAEGCRKLRRFLVTVDNHGEIAKRERIGWCEPEPRLGFRAPAAVPDGDIDRETPIRAQECQDYLDFLVQRTAILFEPGSAELTEENFPFLRRVARVLNRCPDVRVEIAGHTDADGPPEVNRELSDARARVVARFLADHGVARARLEPVGYGEQHPIASNETPGGRARNRRIEFVLDWRA